MGTLDNNAEELGGRLEEPNCWTAIVRPDLTS